jgi:hypothetical protein
MSTNCCVHSLTDISLVGNVMSGRCGGSYGESIPVKSLNNLNLVSEDYYTAIKDNAKLIYF